ncbi:MAG TPA: TIM-barrel domain-containing protein [Phycisphaerales bacterium]|nr:TIM-barrel domain-containing protein [Phycisphaerales bacterium]
MALIDALGNVARIAVLRPGMRSRGSRTPATLLLMAVLSAAPASALAWEVQPAGQSKVVGEPLGNRIGRYYPSEESKQHALPSMAFERPAAISGVLPDGLYSHPSFTTDGTIQTVTFPVEPGTSLYGTGEVAGPLLRNGRTIETWNYDAYGYDDTYKNLYQSHPWVLGVRADGSAFGILADTTYRVKVDMSNAKPSGGTFSFSAPGPAFPVIVIERKHPMEVVTALAQLTGTIAMPPKWALGYHQCRYSYFPDSRVMEIAKGFRDRNIPCDVIWHDIDYMHKFLCFTFDEKHFPDPKRHNANLHALGFKSVWMIDPGIAADKANFKDGKYEVYETGTAQDVWVKQADGKTTYRGEVWPGWCVFPDFTRQETRVWWAGLYKDWMANGIDGVWNDMNEPAIFNTPDKSKTMPEDNKHRPDAEFAAPSGDNPGEHARWHNVYGMLMVKATREGVMAANPDKRPFVLSRASYIGGHRYGAMWTGDNSADWYHLESSVSMALNMGLSGQPFAGPDIGGFAGNGPAGDEGRHFARWMGFGTLLPFARAHTATGNIDKEPWSFGPEVEKTCRQAIERRYRFLPYIYTLFREASVSGTPVARPLFFVDPRDQALRAEDDVFLLGGDVMVVPSMMPDHSRVVTLPKPANGVRWLGFDFEDGDNADLPAMYLRPGAIVPTGPVMQFVDQKPLDTLTLLVALDHRGRAAGTLYEDAGEGYGYQNGEFLLTSYTADRNKDTVTVRVLGVEGGNSRPNRKVVVKLLLDGDTSGPGSVCSSKQVRIITAEGKDGDPIVLKIPS